MRLGVRGWIAKKSRAEGRESSGAWRLICQSEFGWCFGVFLMLRACLGASVILCKCEQNHEPRGQLEGRGSFTWTDQQTRQPPRRLG